MEDQSPAGVPVVSPQEVESDLRRKAFFTGTVAEIDARMEAGQQAFAQSLYGIEYYQRQKEIEEGTRTSWWDAIEQMRR